MRGRIVKGIGGLYFVETKDGIVECKAKGVFRKNNIKPLIGDHVEIEMIDSTSGVITDVLDRTSYLIRPEVANASQAMLVFAVTNPMPSFNLADRFLVFMESRKIKSFLVFNKADLATEEEKAAILEVFKNTGYRIFFTSAKQNIGVDEVKGQLKGETTVLAGPSGVGKSTLVNLLQDHTVMETGEISEKIMRGKHTTRHSELLRVDEESWIFDTPGFTSFDVFEDDPQKLWTYYPEMDGNNCRFIGCAHVNEPDCAVKKQVEDGFISKTRYSNYLLLYKEIKNRKRF